LAVQPFAGRRPAWLIAVLLGCLAHTGCTAILSPVSGVPAHRLPSEFFAKPKNNLQPIDAYRLRQDPPAAYLIDSGDILGIWIQGILGNEGEPLPFQLPGKDSDLPPSIGYPIVVREDGTISLPFIAPILVRGLTLGQVEKAIRKAYTEDQSILQPGRDRIIVTIMRERTYRVIVLRQDRWKYSNESWSEQPTEKQDIRQQFPVSGEGIWRVGIIVASSAGVS